MVTTKRQLRNSLASAERQIEWLERDLRDERQYNGSLQQRANEADNKAAAAQRRADMALAVVTNGKDNLSQLFGPLSDLGADETDTCLRYASDDELALVYVNPANGEVWIHDPREAVGSIRVTFDSFGDLSEEEQRRVQRFRAEALLMRQAAPQPIRGALSLYVRNSRQEELPEEQTGANTQAD